jgi:thymidylate kinase
VPPEVSAERLQSRQSTLPFVRDRIEEGDKYFFARVAQGYEAIAVAEPQRVHLINGAKPVDVVCAKIWEIVQPILPRVGRW